MITNLIDKGHAYRNSDGSVYFDVRSFPTYGHLSRLADREITTNTVDREQDDDYERNSAADFCFMESFSIRRWPQLVEVSLGPRTSRMAHRVQRHGHEAPWESFDLHSGGIDLVFPHHENEIAQSEAVTGKKFANHWFHVAHLTVEGVK